MYQGVTATLDDTHYKSIVAVGVTPWHLAMYAGVDTAASVDTIIDDPDEASAAGSDNIMASQHFIDNLLDVLLGHQSGYLDESHQMQATAASGEAQAQNLLDLLHLKNGHLCESYFKRVLKDKMLFVDEYPGHHGMRIGSHMVYYKGVWLCYEPILVEVLDHTSR